MRGTGRERNKRKEVKKKKNKVSIHKEIQNYSAKVNKETLPAKQANL